MEDSGAKTRELAGPMFALYDTNEAANRRLSDLGLSGLLANLEKRAEEAARDEAKKSEGGDGNRGGNGQPGGGQQGGGQQQGDECNPTQAFVFRWRPPFAFFVSRSRCSLRVLATPLRAETTLTRVTLLFK